MAASRAWACSPRTHYGCSLPHRVAASHACGVAACAWATAKSACLSCAPRRPAAPGSGGSLEARSRAAIAADRGERVRGALCCAASCAALGRREPATRARRGRRRGRAASDPQARVVATRQACPASGCRRCRTTGCSPRRCRSTTRHATQGSNPRLAEAPRQASATHALGPRLGQPVIAYLLDIKSSSQLGGGKSGFQLAFVFAENPYFTDKVLTKTYLMDPEDEDECLERAVRCEITWNPTNPTTPKPDPDH